MVRRFSSWMVSTRIRDGVITGLIGPSGCGKTTFLRCLNRVNERYGNVRTEGMIDILGKNIYDDDVSLIELRKSVGMVFQLPNPLPISVYENVVFGLRIHKQRSELASLCWIKLSKKPYARCVCGLTSRIGCTIRQLICSLNSNRSSALLGFCHSSRCDLDGRAVFCAGCGSHHSS